MDWTGLHNHIFLFFYTFALGFFAFLFFLAPLVCFRAVKIVRPFFLDALGAVLFWGLGSGRFKFFFHFYLLLRDLVR